MAEKAMDVSEDLYELTSNSEIDDFPIKSDTM